MTLLPTDVELKVALAYETSVRYNPLLFRLQSKRLLKLATVSSSISSYLFALKIKGSAFHTSI